MSGTLSWSCLLRRGSKYKGTKISLVSDLQWSTGAIFVQRPASQFPKVSFNKLFRYLGTTHHSCPVQIHRRYSFGPFQRCHASLSLSFSRALSSRLNPPDCDRGLEPVCNFDEFSSPCCKTRPNASFASAAMLMLSTSGGDSTGIYKRHHGMWSSLFSEKIQKLQMRIR